MLSLRVFDKLLGVLVDTEVCEVDVSFLDVLELGGVLVGRKSGEALVEDKDLQRVVAGDQDVYSQIILIVVNEMGVGNILGSLVVFTVFDLGVLGDHFYASPAGGVRGLQNPKLVFLGVLS